MEEDIRKTAEELLNRLKEESKPKNIYEYETVVPNYILLPLKDLMEELIEKNKEQEKVIELMAEYIDFDKIELNCTSLCVKDGCRENCIIDYFRKKAR